MSDDLKYVLLPSIEDRRRPPKFQPWYRERIKMKYPVNMNTKNWKFVKDGLDDFRDGLPPPHDDIILEPEKGPGPILLSENRCIKSTASNVQDRLKEHQIYFSREIPAAERRRLMIENYISTLLDHPMAFFEHFNETLTPETYERVTKLLEAELLRSTGGEEQVIFGDEHRELTSLSPSGPATRPETSFSEKSVPELNLQHTEKTTPNELNEETLREQDESDEKSDSKSSSTRPTRSGIVYDESGNQWDAEELERKQKNPYRWFIEKQREKQRAKGPSQDEQAATAMESHLRDVSEHFCNWLHDLGGTTNVDIDPAVVRNLFSTAYDTKPSLSVPIKVVEMTRVPFELREGVEESIIPESRRIRGSLSHSRTTSAHDRSKETSSTFLDRDVQSKKYRYGAWYLPKNLWQRSLAAEELRDPKVVKAEREDATRKREQEINARLAPLHGVDAFKEYLQEKNIRRLPKLITQVEQYRRDHPRELANSTAELQAKRKGLSTS